MVGWTLKRITAKVSLNWKSDTAILNNATEPRSHARFSVIFTEQGRTHRLQALTHTRQFTGGDLKSELVLSQMNLRGSCFIFILQCNIYKPSEVSFNVLTDTLISSLALRTGLKS